MSAKPTSKLNGKATAKAISGNRDIIPVEQRIWAYRRQLWNAAVYTFAIFAVFHLFIQSGYALITQDWSQITLVTLLSLQLYWPDIPDDGFMLPLSFVIIAIIWFSFIGLQIWMAHRKRK